ncbi:hypothetical protein [Companilactobacillus kimchii]|nr:hypothetical protein [Companilactobacillus kimchii]
MKNSKLIKNGYCYCFKIIFVYNENNRPYKGEDFMIGFIGAGSIGGAL